MRRFLHLFILAGLLIALAHHAPYSHPSPSRALAHAEPAHQTADLLYNEARTVHLGNLARRANGIPPLRWNRQLTAAARWFAWDSTENRPFGYCGHQDTNGNWPVYRARAFGYLGFAGAENAFCGYVSPESAIEGWMNSPGHRANLLDPASREVGLGYYQRSSDGRGYIVQKFGVDSVHAPVIIENEAPFTPNPNVNLYIYNRTEQSGFASMGPATQMMVSNDACFSDRAWEPFASHKTWTLEGGQGWRTVYVKTRDALNRTATVSDTIYLGEPLPVQELSDTHLSTTQPYVTLYHLDGGGLPMVQFSLGWIADDTYPTFGRLRGDGERVSDPDAWGGTAYRLLPGRGETSAWVWDTAFIKDTPMTAYIRLKTGSNVSNQEIARVTVKGGGVEYGPRRLRGVDFAAPNQYQEFAIDFTFHSNPNEPFLIFQFWRSGTTDIYVDAVTIFSRPQPITSPLTWNVPGGNYRGQGVWVRYTDGVRFSGMVEAATTPMQLFVSPTELTFLAARDGTPPPAAFLHVVPACAAFTWEISHNAPWLNAEKTGSGARISVNPAGLSNGIYSGNVTVRATGGASTASVSVPVRLIVVDRLFPVYLPLTARGYW
jgi:uncharacterized protein YkwD